MLGQKSVGEALRTFSKNIQRKKHPKDCLESALSSTFYAPLNTTDCPFPILHYLLLLLIS